MESAAAVILLRNTKNTERRIKERRSDVENEFEQI